MKGIATVVLLAAASVMPLPPASADPQGRASESRVPVASTSLYAREIGRGRPIIVLHGGPDFDHRYLLPDLDRLAETSRLIYYDQRGRGLSADGVQPEDVTLASDLQDLDVVRQHFQLNAMALLGHSWGTVLALEYALRYPGRVSHLILMNPAPASTRDLGMFRKVYAEKLGPDLDRQKAMVASAAYQNADPDAVTARYRIHFKAALASPEHYERLMSAMKQAFEKQGAAGIIKARAVEDRLMLETWANEAYDLLPKAASLRIPTLVMTGDRDFFPVDIAAHIARAIPNARLATLTNCGHFAYLECPDDVRKALTAFLSGAASR